ncbi:hypothetical protein QUB10_07255 [Microcoleus sp. B5-D4]|uniref:hypothetical protein n=1 Tax=unclassified Microcoleus TaxID=2642155 RepID=UPI002FD4CB9C
MEESASCLTQVKRIWLSRKIKKIDVLTTSFITKTHRKDLAGNREIKFKTSRLKSSPQRLDFLSQPAAKIDHN